MLLTLSLPLLYLLAGILIGKTAFDPRRAASALLSRWLIPIIIVYNIATYRQGVFTVIAGTMAMMAALLLAARLFSRDPVQNLCFCYTNVGWLGLPLGSALFGEQGASLLIAAYIGNSLFGNSAAAALFAPELPFRQRMVKIFRSPPVAALALGILCLPLGGWLAAHAHAPYQAAKWLMSLTGMAVLGIWLAKTPLQWRGLKPALLQFAARAALFGTLIFLFCRWAQYAGIALIADHQAAFGLLALLPPAANLVALETHYLGSGRSAAMIAWGTLVSLAAIAIYYAVWVSV